MSCFAQVNVSGESQKHGLAPEEAANFFSEAAKAGPLDFKGLMTMAPWSEDPEDARPAFRALGELLGELNRRAAYRRPLEDLSMGMSADFQVAVEEGATWVRVGGRLFQPADAG